MKFIIVFFALSLGTVTAQTNELITVTSDEVEVDHKILKGQGRSLISWETLVPETWLDIHDWMVQRDIKDKNPDWKLRVRDADHQELIGKIIKCHGSCKRFRGIDENSVQHLSRIEEGDEIRTEKNSVAWIYLMEGSLIRLGPESSLSLQEIDLEKSQNFLLLRLSRGHIFYHARQIESLSMDTNPETDSLLIPVLIREANQVFYERKLFNQTLLPEFGLKEQLEALNGLRQSNKESFPSTTNVMVVTPTATVSGVGASFDLVYVGGGKSYFNKRSASDLTLGLRGHSQVETPVLTERAWYEVQKDGREYQKLTDPPGELQLLELITRRILTLELAREIWVRDFSLPILKATSDPKQLAVEFGYTLWSEEDLKKRQQFLVEYTRRLETTNLKSLDNLLLRLEQKGEKVDRELSGIYPEDSIKHYLLGLKSRYTDQKMQLREMNDLQYYVWILKNGKL